MDEHTESDSALLVAPKKGQHSNIVVDKTLSAVILEVRWRIPIGTTYYLEHRKSDKSVEGKFALYGGAVEDNEKDDPKTTAQREMKEETDIAVSKDDLIPLCELVGYQDGETIKAHLYKCIWPSWGHTKQNRPSKSKIVRYRRNELKRNAADVDFGPPVKIYRFFKLWWIINWSKLGPIAAYSLLSAVKSKE